MTVLVTQRVNTQRKTNYTEVEFFDSNSGISGELTSLPSKKCEQNSFDKVFVHEEKKEFQSDDEENNLIFEKSTSFPENSVNQCAQKHALRTQKNTNQFTIAPKKFKQIEINEISIINRVTK